MNKKKMILAGLFTLALGLSMHVADPSDCYGTDGDDVSDCRLDNSCGDPCSIQRGAFCPSACQSCTTRTSGGGGTNGGGGTGGNCDTNEIDLGLTCDTCEMGVGNSAILGKICWNDCKNKNSGSIRQSPDPWVNTEKNCKPDPCQELNLFCRMALLDYTDCIKTSSEENCSALHQKELTECAKYTSQCSPPNQDPRASIVGGGSAGGGSITPKIVPPAPQPKPQPAPAPSPVPTATPPPIPGSCSAWVCGQNGNAFCANWIGSGTPPTKYCSDLPGSSGGNNGNGGVSECSGFNFAHIACQSHTGCVYNYDTQHCSANTSNCQQERVCNSEDSNGNGTDCSFQEVCH